jgi:hypothetical protein
VQDHVMASASHSQGTPQDMTDYVEGSIEGMHGCCCGLPFIYVNSGLLEVDTYRWSQVAQVLQKIPAAKRYSKQ